MVGRNLLSQITEYEAVRPPVLAPARNFLLEALGLQCYPLISGAYRAAGALKDLEP